MDNQQEKIVRTLLMRITQRPAIYFDVNVTEHCNLNCKYCGSFAPIADKEFLDIQEYRNDITRLAEIAGGYVITLIFLEVNHCFIQIFVKY